MQFVKTADLKPGMRLAKPIYNRMGVLLYERDTRLTIQGINSIENFGLIGIFILEPAEPLPPLSREDLEFEQFQTIYMFKLKDNMDKLVDNLVPSTLLSLVDDIQRHYGSLDHKLNFTQTLRSSADFVYKHSISVGILSAMISNEMQLPAEDIRALITASLLY
ncbi:MAG: phosphohydrolase, partial [Roseburia hominis]